MMQKLWAIVQREYMERVRTKWFLLRGDYGVVLDPRPGERRSRFYFSIGQAF